jgi:hypothetical protein
MSGETGRHQWNKGPRLKEATTSEEGEDIRKDLQKTVEFEVAKQIVGTSIRLRLGDVGALATLSSIACTERRRRMMVINLDRLVPCDSRRGFELDIGFNDHFYSRLGTTSNYSAIVNIHNSQINTSAMSFPACCFFTSRSLETASNSGDSSISRAQVLSERMLPCICPFSSQTQIHN